MNWQSKTDTPCDCGWLSLAINDSTSGICFDAKSNFILLRTGQMDYVLYHCPSCGGAYPDHSKPMWVPIIPEGEFDRMNGLIQGFTDVQGILDRLGAPDYDVMSSGTAVPIRCIEYYRLSDWLNVEFGITANQAPVGRLEIKLLSARPLTNADAP